MTKNRPLLPRCGQYRSRRGHRWTESSLADHERQCYRCCLIIGQGRDPDLDLIDDLVGDGPDGVYWAVAHELGGGG